ncbi:MAG: 4-(cytidine 5'-diphospho)-2-C-methyl-D-erythritol kinase [Verrucomicrobia bacterium]|nr:4-(cytidine 5'-diphospho)-2-C-methyl-D-erythritol kinase [Verrucomicrobiota bacterium]
MIVETPAKINLTLEVLGRRTDGFHELATWMVPVGVFDRLEIVLGEKDEFTTDTPGLAWNDHNLVYRAVGLFRQETGIRSLYRIRLTKRIPIGAGLAGGSSNAAATLRLLNRLHGEPFTDEALIGLAARLGSDAAFFVRCEPAWCTGRGEKMAPRPFARGLWLLLVKPGFAVPTAAAYAAYAGLPAGERRGQPVATGWGELRNDLEPAVFRKYVLLPLVKGWLARQPETTLSLMSGSGSTLFGLTAEAAQADELQRRFVENFGARFWIAVCPLNPAMPKAAGSGETQEW